MLHALNKMEEIYNEKIDIIILLRPTSPLRPSGLIEEGINLLTKNPAATSIRTVALSKEHPYRQWNLQKGFITGFSNELVNNIEPYNLPRQELPKVFFQTGDIEVIRRQTLLSGSVSGNKILPIVIDESEVMDIDNISDLENAQSKFNVRT